MVLFVMLCNITKIRNSFGNRQISSYIRDIRDKIHISRCEKHDSLRNGTYLIVVRDKKEVLVCTNPRKNSGVSLPRICYNGESLEENVRREVAEEVGVEVSDVQYVASQHWALTGSSLMIGCFASTKDDKFSIDPVELEAAGWFNRIQVKSALDKVTEKKDKLLKNPDDIWVPPPGAVAHSLLKKWLQIW